MWTFEVERRRVKTKTKICTVSAFSHEEAIELAKRKGRWEDPEAAEVTAHTEYVAREL